VNDVLDEMACAEFAFWAEATSDGTSWEDLDPEAKAMFRRSAAAAPRAALGRLFDADDRLVGIRPGPQRDESQRAYDEAVGKARRPRT